MVKIDKTLIDELLAQAKVNPRLRQNFDLRTSTEDGSQRMLNALMPGTEVAIHRHPMSTENVFLLRGKMVEIFFEEEDTFQSSAPLLSPEQRGQKSLKGDDFPYAMDAWDVVRKRRLRETERILLDPSSGNYGCVVPAGVWHTVEVLEPTVMYESKDGKYGEDGSEVFG